MSRKEKPRGACCNVVRQARAKVSSAVVYCESSLRTVVATPSRTMPEFEFPVTSAQLAPLLATALARSSHEGARIVALHWLHALVRARHDWSDGRDESTANTDSTTARQAAADALHHARVALRRLRATLREHRTSLLLDEGPRIRRALRRLGKATNAARGLCKCH